MAGWRGGDLKKKPGGDQQGGGGGRRRKRKRAPGQVHELPDERRADDLSGHGIER